MEILQKDQDGNGIFYMEKNGETVAEMTYRRQGTDRMIIDHTEVSDILKGTGAGMSLLDAAVTFAKENELKIVPLCPYVKHQFEKTPDKYADVAA